MKILFLVNNPDFFITHRLPIAIEAIKLGYEVHVAAGKGGGASKIRSLGLSYHELPISRSGKNIFSELHCFFSILQLCRRLKPKILHLVTIKPVLYGGIAARLTSVEGVVAAVSGLGFVFMAKGFKASILRGTISFLYRLALSKQNLKVIFQNPDDRKALMRIGAVTYDKSALIRGSGVDLSLYLYRPEGASVPVVTFAARLLKDKGVMEFVEAAYILASRGVSARFQVVGDPDPGNPTSLSYSELERWRDDGFIECLGYRQDIAQVFANAHVVVLPSYREGLPKVLIEAAACGRAVITTDVPGCRDAIEPDVTGLLVPVRDAIALADAIERLVVDTSLRQKMGRAGRELAEREFSIENVVQQHLEIYRGLEVTNDSA
ncbi:glycosyltransferase family 4 protein [Pseudomonas sp. D2-5]